MTGNSPSSPTVVFRNDAAVIAWVLLPFWFVVLVPFTREAMITGSVLVMGFLTIFWIAGIGLLVWVPRIPRIEVAVGQGDVRVVERFPLSTRIRRFACSEVTVSPIEECAGEGTSYTCWLVLPQGQHIPFANGSTEEQVRRQRERLVAALALSLSLGRSDPDGSQPET